MGWLAPRGIWMKSTRARSCEARDTARRCLAATVLNPLFLAPHTPSDPVPRVIPNPPRLHVMKSRHAMDNESDSRVGTPRLLIISHHALLFRSIH